MPHSDTHGSQPPCGWSRYYKEAESLLKAEKEKGKPLGTYDEYVQAKKDGFTKKEEEYKQKLEEHKAKVAALAPGEKKPKEPSKPSKPHTLKKLEYEQVAQTKAIPGKLTFGEYMIELQMIRGRVAAGRHADPQHHRTVRRLQGRHGGRPAADQARIVILGSYYLWSDVLKVGVIGLVLVVAFVLGTQVMVSIWGRRSKVAEGLAGVMGATICPLPPRWISPMARPAVRMQRTRSC